MEGLPAVIINNVNQGLKCAVRYLILVVNISRKQSGRAVGMQYVLFDIVPTALADLFCVITATDIWCLMAHFILTLIKILFQLFQN